jgi:peptidoglycan/LPS O-acetylase OafA/YrhL
MDWLIAAVIGGVLGMVVSLIGRGLRMPQSLGIVVGIAGALAGAGLAHVTGYSALGGWTVYFGATIVAIGFLAGAFLAFSLTEDEERV